jgi:Zn-dependent metalloprotease
MNKICGFPSILLLLLSFGGLARAQAKLSGLSKQQVDELGSEVQQLQKDYPSAKVELNEKKMPLLLTGLDKDRVKPPGPNQPSPQELVKAFLAKYSLLFRANTKVSPSDTFGMLKAGAEPRNTATSDFNYGAVAPDPFVEGRTTVVVQQTLNGVPIFGAEAKVAVNMQAAAVAKFDGSQLVAPTAIETNPKNSAEQAIASANQQYARDLASEGPTRQEEKQLFPNAQSRATATLLITDTKKLGFSEEQLKLTYKVNVGSFVYLVDATDLSTLYSYRDLAHSLVREIRDWGGNINQPVPGVMLNEAGDQLIKPVSPDATTARSNAGVCYQHFASTLSRDRLCETDCQSQNAPSKVSLNVEYGDDGSFWSSSTAQLYFAKGWVAPIEILCHEYTHAIVQYTSGLIYAGESGAVNESLADLFGVLVRNDGTWSIGTELPDWSDANPLRDMGDPRKKNHFNPDIGYDSATNSGQPDNYGNRVDKNQAICRNLFLNDNGCVHINSGILNYSFFLASEGGHDASNHSYPGIGRAKLEKIVYHALKTAMVSTTDMKTAASEIFNSCQILSGASVAGIGLSDCDSVKAAFVSVALQ